MKHTELALRRPVSTVMLFAALAMIGAVASRLLPLEQFPNITLPFMAVSIPYPGSTPDEVEELITRPVEDALATLPSVKRIRSTSSGDEARLQIELDWGSDVRAASFEVRGKLDSIRHQLPSGANRIVMFTESAANLPILTVRLSATQDLSTQYDLLEQLLKKPIERVDGVARVDLAGVEPREVRILLDAGRIAAHGVDVRALVSLLERSNFSVSAGQISDQGQRLLVRPLGEFRTLDQLRDLVISGDLRLRDVASIELISPDLTTRRRLDGRPAVGFDVFKSSQSNVVEVADRVLAVIERARTLPQMQGITIFVIENQATSIRRSLADVGESGLLGALFAIIVLYAFMRHWPTTLSVSLAVPVSLLVTLAAMYFLDMSLNVMSMMGMMLAVGMLVDNAVVVTESVFKQRLLMPDRPFEATLAGVREVGVATLAGTATSIVVFLPILFGDLNEMTVFLVHVAIPIVVAMIASLVVAQTLIPMLTARVAPPPAHHSRWITRLQDQYVSALRWLLGRRRRPAMLLGGLIGLTAALLVLSAQFDGKLLKIDMFPQDAGRMLVVEYRINGSHPIDRVEAAVLRVEGYFESRRDELGIESIYSRFDSESANSVLVLRSDDREGLSAAEVISRATQEMPEIVIGKPSFSFDESAMASGLTLQLSGESTERLAEISTELERELRSIPGLETVRSLARDGDSEVQIAVDRARAAALGVDPQQVAMSVAAALRGDRLREFRGSERELTMRLAFRANDRQTLEDLLALPIYLPGGERVTLGSIATLGVQRAPRAIERIDRLTTVVIEGTLAPEATLPAVRERVEQRLAAYRLPPGYSWKFGRGVEQQDDTAMMMQLNLLLAIAIIYLVMAALFESALLPLSIISSILLAVIGVLWTLFITRTTLTFMALIGIQILMGVVVNIGIVLVAHINDLRKAGLERHAAILQAGRDRLRPILMTTLTTVLGLAPLALGESQLAVGTVGPSYAPMARAIMGGLAFGAVMSLFFVPALYVWLDDAAAATARMLARTRPGTAASKAPDSAASATEP